MPYPPLPRDFYNRPALAVARDLLGATLVRVDDGEIISGIITETEAYQGEEDLACHARAGRTPRTAVMYGPAGIAYVYFTYGMHWMLNVVTDAVDTPAAVLIRAIRPIQGIDRIAQRRRGQPPAHWTDGPAKLTLALGIDGRHNGLDLCDPSGACFIAPGPVVPDKFIQTTPRIGLFSVPEPWKSVPWRFITTSPAADRHQST